MKHTKTDILVDILLKYSSDFIVTALSSSSPHQGLINRPPSMRGKPYVTRYNRIGAANLFIYLFIICAAQKPPSIMKSYRKAAQDYLPTTSLKWKRIQSNERNQTNNEASNGKPNLPCRASFLSLPSKPWSLWWEGGGGKGGGRSALEGVVGPSNTRI